MVERHGEMWNKVASYIPRRTAQQCRSRYLQLRQHNVIRTTGTTAAVAAAVAANNAANASATALAAAAAAVALQQQQLGTDAEASAWTY